MSETAAPGSGRDSRVSEGGAEARVRLDDLLPGRCGANTKAESRGKEGPLEYCQHLAGRGTGEIGIGRCDLHIGMDGLPPWAGEIPQELLLRIAGTKGSETGGAVTKIRETFEEYIRALLPEEDQRAFDSVDVDPVRVIDTEIRLNRTAAARVHRWLAAQHMDQAVRELDAQSIESHTQHSRVVTAESSLRDLAKTLARLMEVRARYSEMADERRKDDFLRQTLRDLPMGDFATLRREPWRLHQYLNPGRI